MQKKKKKKVDLLTVNMPLSVYVLPSDVLSPCSVSFAGDDKTASSVWLCFKLVLTSSKLCKGQDLQSGCR